MLFKVGVALAPIGQPQSLLPQQEYFISLPFSLKRPTFHEWTQHINWNVLLDIYITWSKGGKELPEELQAFLLLEPFSTFVCTAPFLQTSLVCHGCIDFFYHAITFHTSSALNFYELLCLFMSDFIIYRVLKGRTSSRENLLTTCHCNPFDSSSCHYFILDMSYEFSVKTWCYARFPPPTFHAVFKPGGE